MTSFYYSIFSITKSVHFNCRKYPSSIRLPDPAIFTLMTHNEKRDVWWKEGLIGLGVGVLYGTTSVAVGHPFDTVKTKMQAQAGFEKANMFQTFGRTLRTQGVRGLYRGALPPLMGSGIFRSAQFAAFEGMYTFLGDRLPSTKHEIPLTGGLQVCKSMSVSSQSNFMYIINNLSAIFSKI